MMKRIFTLFLLGLLICSLLAGCAAKMDSNANGKGQMLQSPGAAGEGIYDSTSNQETTEIIGRKLIRTITIQAETKDLDALMADLDAQLATLGGYVQNKQVHGSASENSQRYASMTLRIPAEKLDQFVGHVAGATNVLSSGETTEDVTLKFIATESRIAALEAEEARVMELIAKAENISELLVLESKLSDIRQELEEVKSQLKLYENLVDYGTVYLNITEKQVYTVVDEPEQTVWERISTGFVSSLKGVGFILTELFVFFVVASPYLTILVAIGVIVWICLHLSKKRAKGKDQTEEPQN
ncbi:MAG: DUF4349 domain-containing protein [Oscillospiraceae bacterium]|nr:DUF4349 domain-containing protein [Oscillospiraceae bacterium]